MKAAIHNPYLDSLGGGERYTASLVSLLLREGYSVDLEWDDAKIVNILQKRFSLDLKNAKVVKDIKKGDGYDLLFWVSDGSIPALKSRNNILHFQVPFKNVNGKSLINRMKLFRIKSVVCNSNFTKGFIDKEFGVDSIVIHPPVDIKKISAKRKENLILYVGRFSQLTQSKNQHLLVDAFKKFFDNGNGNWKLVLAGGGEIGAEKYIKKLKSSATGYPVSIFVSPSFAKLKDLYGKAKIFWSASGFAVDEEKSPEKVEHFGITVVEAMAAKCVPIISSKGGHREIVTDKENGFFWRSEKELLKISKELVKNQKLLLKIGKSAKGKSNEFSLERFEKEFTLIL